MFFASGGTTYPVYTSSWTGVCWRPRRDDALDLRVSILRDILRAGMYAGVPRRNVRHQGIRHSYNRCSSDEWQPLSVCGLN